MTRAQIASFGTMPGGQVVAAVTLTNRNGLTARVLTYGATLQALTASDRDGTMADIVLGHATLAEYLAERRYFGVTVGRYANRIRHGRFAIDGKAYAIACNNGENSLHGGEDGFDTRCWTIADAAASAVTLTLTSPDGDQGYPGELHVTATYELDDSDALHVTYTATTDAPTIVNLTNHSFFNLTGEGSGTSILSHQLTIAADACLPVDATMIPTGEIRPVAGTPFDFRQPRAIGDRIRDASDDQIRLGQGYDHNYVLRAGDADGMRVAATVTDPASGRVLTLETDQPGLQLYSGNFLDGRAIGKAGRAYRQSDGLALEPQLFPDTPNQPAFGSARLDPGATYCARIIYRLSVDT
ncbi:aldose epimerase family protein [Sphingomonas sp. Leaf17]|uniref:aldose epimerase family protein n=1 Tax=Sphingomonas sp. Leaf17 TaxID=1735683 RepID=UPI000A69EB45|nr:aldose epimerase family protein [Sphingomonas sp. Leaf17]